MSDLATELNALREDAARLEIEESAFQTRLRKLEGMMVQILCPHYNGQPYGRSKKPLTGKTFKIAWALRWGKTIGVGFSEHSDGIKIEDVMFIQERTMKDSETA